MNTPHTPGPYHLTQSSAGTLDVCKTTGDIRSIICRLHVEHLAEEHGGSIKANAQLIASAPSLLAQRNALRQALQAIVDLASPDLTPPSRIAQTAPAFDQARAALALVKEVGK